MVGRTPACLAVLFAAAKIAIAQVPALHLEYIDQQHKTARVGSQPIRAPSTERIRLIVVLEPLPSGAQQMGGERLEVRAENQTPGYFDNRPPANISFVVRCIQPQGAGDLRRERTVHQLWRPSRPGDSLGRSDSDFS